MLASGTRIKQYEILSHIGSGGMGHVYLATDTTLRRRVAVKLLPPELMADEHAGLRMIQEARAAARLDHPNICAIHEIGEDGARRFIVMPFVEGETLAARLARGALDPRSVIDLGVQVASALAEAHAHGVFHRDIKPQNIMLDARGQVKVLDFGIAATEAGGRGADAETATQLTTPGTVMGTWPYMSPEQVRGAAVDGRSDIFSLGVVLFEAAWGVHPFEAGSTAEVVSNILTKDPFQPPGLGAGGAPGLVSIVRRCVEKEPSRRYRSAADLAADLARLRAGREAEAARPGRSRGMQAAVLVVAILGLAAVTAAAVRWRSPRAPAAPTTTQGNLPYYESYMRGRVKLKAKNRESLDAAIELLQASVTAKPDFAPAQAALAIAMLNQAFEFSAPEEQKRLIEDAELAIEKALALDPKLAEAHLARGLLVWTQARGFPHEMAIRAYRKAIELDPNLDEAHHLLGIIYMHVGLLDTAWDETQRALSINPDNSLARLRLGVIALYRGDDSQAIEIVEGVPEEANPNYRARALADALFRMARFREAADVVDGFLKNNAGDEGGLLTSVKAMLLAREGKRDEAERAIRHAVEIGQTAGHFHHTAYNIGCAYAILGRPDLAVHWLRVAARDGFPCYPYFKNDKTLDPIRNALETMALLDELKKQYEDFRKLK